MLKASYISSPYIRSSIWLIGEKIVRLLLTLGATIMLARHLGPKDFGTLNFGIAVMSILLPLANFGLNGIVANSIAKNEKFRNTYVITAGVIKACIGIVLYSLFTFISSFVFDETTFWIIAILNLNILLQPFTVLQIECEALGKGSAFAKRSLWGIVVSNSLKILGVLFTQSLLFYAFCTILEYLVTYFALSFNRVKALSLKNFNFKIARSYMKRSWYLIISGLAGMIYLKIDQVMLNWLHTEYEVGIYSVAARLSEVWYFIPVTIASGIFPQLTKNKNNPEKYREILKKLFVSMSIISIAITVLVLLLGEKIIPLLFGQEYLGSIPILNIHILSGIFVFWGAIFSKWIIIEKKFHISLIRHVVGAILNVSLNIIFISKWGGVGAAFATLISYAAANFFIMFFMKETIWLGKLILKSHRYIQKNI